MRDWHASIPYPADWHSHETHRHAHRLAKRRGIIDIHPVNHAELHVYAHANGYTDEHTHPDRDAKPNSHGLRDAIADIDA